MLKIIIPGVPVPQARMRHSNFGGFVKIYDPNAKDKVRIREFLNKNGPYECPEFPRISFLFQMPIPKGITKRDTNLYNSGLLKHVKKPDCDNLIKLIADCLDGIVFKGDQQVSIGAAAKVYHPEPKTIIWIHSTQSVLQPWEFAEAFSDELPLGAQCS